MRKLLAAFALFLSSSMVSASQIYYDGFNYTSGTPLGTNGTLHGNGTWAASSNSTTTPTIVSGNLTYPGITSVGSSVALQQSGGAGARISTGAVTSGTLYYSFIVNLASLTSTEAATSGAGGAYFAGFDSHTSTATFDSAAGLYVREDATTTTDVDLGIATTGAANKVYSTTAYSPNDSIFVVASLTIGGVATLDVYADGASIPTVAPVSHTATSSGSDTLSTVNTFYFRDNPGEPSITADELRIGTTWASVTPEPTSLSALSLAAVGLLLRRRKQGLLS